MRSCRANLRIHLTETRQRTAAITRRIYLDLLQLTMYVYVEAIGMKKTDDKFGLPQGTLDLLIMRVVALGPIHGYAIAQRIQQISRDALQVQQGSLYPALHRLEYKKLLSSRWKPSETGREAKFYELTSKGRTHLKVETENWTRLTDVVSLILEGTLEGI
jgi:PadR family transcriptional regulator, regulatory protein PadR